MPPVPLLGPPSAQSVAKWLTSTYGVMLAVDIIMALSFEQSMQMGEQGYFDYELRHLKKWQMITIGGVAAYTFLSNNDEIFLGYRPLTMVPGYYNIGQLTLMLAAAQAMLKRARRPDSPSDYRGGPGR